MDKPDVEKMSLRMESIWMDAENRISFAGYARLERSHPLQITRLTDW